MRTMVPIGEIATHIAELEARCSRCDRHKTLSVQRLLQLYGADASLEPLKNALKSRCPRRHESIYKRCDIYFPQLSQHF